MAESASASSGGTSVFDGGVKVLRRVPDPGTDHTLPPAGALNYAAITSLTALMSTVGTATSLVTGDHFEMMHGNEIRTIFMDRDHTVMGNQTNTVQQDRHDVTGATQRYHNGATNETFNDQHTNCHASERQMHEPTGYLKVVNESVENISNATKNYGLKVDVSVVKSEATLVSGLEWTSVKAEGRITELVYAKMLGMELGALKVEAKAAEHEMKAIHSHLKAIDNHIGELKAHETAVFFVPIGFGVYV